MPDDERLARLQRAFNGASTLEDVAVASERAQRLAEELRAELQKAVAKGATSLSRPTEVGLAETVLAKLDRLGVPYEFVENHKYIKIELVPLMRAEGNE